ncbi:peptidoglycan binding protein CsiV [Psychrosphaera sp. B3R10]|uniref:CsiV family protein n=1 Tax=unclassified Psychrosphaera TaxID=2641570 RepID=UPI001C09D3A8|nr:MULTISPECIES: CsiV family protein [unclassified Psychrosphaera]MBU2881342.1 peptidoglycan binding protein CsiV [Psychrosphaera sp. I2R16]MBU2988441.1 peptidoglycan binding protein CsiV [Psychrosphaera sp. B3R10]
MMFKFRRPNLLPKPLFSVVCLTFAFQSLAVNAFDINNDDDAKTVNQRVPTEELVEGIKSSDGRWFEVEMIVFARKDASSTRELFDNTIKNLKPRRKWDLLSPMFTPDLTRYLANLDNCWSERDPFTDPSYVNLSESLDLPAYAEQNETGLNDEAIYDDIDGERFDNEPVNTADGSLYKTAEGSDFAMVNGNDITEGEADKVEIITLSDDLAEIQQANRFYQQFTQYQQLMDSNWQFSANLCLLPNESKPLVWQLISGNLTSTNTYNQALPVTDMKKRPTGPDFDDLHNVYLLSPDNLQLMAHYKKIEAQPDLTPIIHMGWRQPGLSKQRAVPVYIVAGKNYTDDFRYDGTPKFSLPEAQSTDPVLDRLTSLPDDKNSQNTLYNEPVFDLQKAEKTNVQLFMEKLQNGAVVDFKNNTLKAPKSKHLPDSTWQLDGTITVHLNHYLYLDAKFNYREPVTQQINTDLFLNDIDPLLEKNETDEASLSTSVVISAMKEDQNLMTNNIDGSKLDLTVLKHYPFEQTRRSYSGDLHYLDHPKFGVIFQIRKYRH